MQTNIDNRFDRTVETGAKLPETDPTTIQNHGMLVNPATQSCRLRDFSECQQKDKINTTSPKPAKSTIQGFHLLEKLDMDFFNLLLSVDVDNIRSNRTSAFLINKQKGKFIAMWTKKKLK